MHLPSIRVHFPASYVGLASLVQTRWQDPQVALLPPLVPPSPGWQPESSQKVLHIQQKQNSGWWVQPIWKICSVWKTNLSDTEKGCGDSRSMELWSVWVYSKHYTLEDERLEPTNHPWKERKMIWTKPLWLCSMLIFRGENDKHSKRSDWNISTPCDLEDSGVPNSSPSSGEIDHP